MIRSSGSPPAKRKTKPPACDACKARRVLCHPQPHGLPCPRCAEKGLICKTNPVPRGRPRTKPLPSALATSSSPASPQQPQSGPSNIPSSYNSLVVVQPSFELSSFWDLPAGLVKHLYESFTNAYQYHRHPLLRNCDLRDTLAAAGWKLCLLHPEARVLAYCACAVSSLISFHSDVIGPGPQPGSFIDASVFFLGANLQSYGMRRAPVFRALHERAVSLACDTRIYLHTSVYNAASCFLLESMEGISSDDSSSRPWATACLSHVRSLAGSWNTVDNLRGLWSAFLMLESLTATARRKPILMYGTFHTFSAITQNFRSHSDQLLITGNEPPPLETVFEQAQASVRASKNPAAYSVFSAIRPYMFHVTRLSRELHDKIKGAPLGHPKPQADEAENIRTCAYAMSVGFTGLALALHREMEYRTAVDERTGTQTQSQWQRTAMLRHQAHEMATRAVDDVPRTLPLLPSPPYNVYVDWAGILGWAEFCLDEADAVGGVSPARIVVFERIMETLKTLGYSRNDPRAVAYIERMGAHAAAYRMAAAYSADQHFAVPDMFAPDNTWMRMLLE
ncbi:hypothetical protein C8J57DRAFT_1372485 [Mycena rebaudengoi]|nr:hypothetical protein C8J57DRAFT_1372485 [Mycena rebaudengoi]